MIKQRFRSWSEHSLDTKGRLNFPSRFREVLQHYDDDGLMVAPWGHKHLRVYPLSEWEIFEEKLRTQGSREPGMASFVRYVVGGVTESNIDKQNRILLPQYLRNVAGIEKNVMLIGMINYVEIWDQESWAHENKTTSDNFDQFEDKLASLDMW